MNCFKISDEVIINCMAEKGMKKDIMSDDKVSMSLSISHNVWLHGSIPTSMSCSCEHFTIVCEGILAIDIVTFDETLEFTDGVLDGFGIWN
jgi:hypothetical protein